MYIIFDEKNNLPQTLDYFHSKSNSNDSYEWWYFEVNFKKNAINYTLVCIFFIGNPFSPYYLNNPLDNKYSINVSLSINDKVESFVFYDFNDEKEFFSKIKIEADRIRINFDEKDFKGHQIKGDLLFKGIDKINLNNTKFSDLNDTWNISHLNYRCEGKLNFKGKELSIYDIGYHDHNYGESLAELYRNTKNWYWGNTHFGNITIIFFYIESLGKKGSKLIVHDKETKIYEDLPILKDKKLTNCFLSLNKNIKYINNDINLNINLKSSQDFKRFGMSGLLYTRAISNFQFKIENREYNTSGVVEFYRPSRMLSPVVKRMMKYGLTKKR